MCSVVSRIIECSSLSQTRLTINTEFHKPLRSVKSKLGGESHKSRIQTVQGGCAVKTGVEPCYKTPC